MASQRAAETLGIVAPAASCAVHVARQNPSRHSSRATDNCSPGRRRTLLAPAEQ